MRDKWAETWTNNFNVENGGNQGILNLIRFGRPYFEAYEGVTGFSQTWNSQSVDASINAMFSITSGTTLTVKVARTEIQRERWSIHCGDKWMETKPWEKQSSCKKAGLGAATLATSMKMKGKPHLLHPGSSRLSCLPLTRAPTTANLSSSHSA